MHITILRFVVRYVQVVDLTIRLHSTGAHCSRSDPMPVSNLSRQHPVNVRQNSRQARRGRIRRSAFTCHSYVTCVRFRVSFIQSLFSIEPTVEISSLSITDLHSIMADTQAIHPSIVSWLGHLLVSFTASIYWFAHFYTRPNSSFFLLYFYDSSSLFFFLIYSVFFEQSPTSVE